MTNGAEDKVCSSNKIRKQLKNLLLVLVGAIIFAFLMGILANVTVNYFTLNTFSRQLFLMFLIPTLIAAVILIYFVYYYYAFVPYSRIKRDILVNIIYDIQNAEVIDDPFDGYHPQKLSWQAFCRYKSRYPQEALEGIQAGMFPSRLKPDQKHILTELLEYIVILQLRSELYGSARTMPKPEKTVKKLPDELEKNPFILLFRESQSDDLIDKGMKQLELYLPEDIEINYWSPATTKGRTFNKDTFQISLVGKYVEILITAFAISMTPIVMRFRPAPIFEGVYIRKYWEEKLVEKLPGLWKVAFHINVEARFKLRFGFFSNLLYLDWAGELINRFSSKGDFGGFDFHEFRNRKMDSLLHDLYEAVRETNVLVRKLMEVQNNNLK